ncbi:hypothetical protein BV25DRAFT_1920563 [Artomyces pyxidatus]|uniref:Uncharacterized protein n=1 Tax=Artomyces pyxidatus TaxID=48021 RepID=A0ACB8SL05_9AGAM|nr:hypothetical protein BV25DRAFT_1920563 [Artomyces pyxidatus]
MNTTLDFFAVFLLFLLTHSAVSVGVAAAEPALNGVLPEGDFVFFNGGVIQNKAPAFFLLYAVCVAFIAYLL